MNHDRSSTPQPRPESRFKWVLTAFFILAGYFLITEHRAHVVEYLPIALLLGCLFLHGFMHGRHGKHRGHGSREEHGRGESSSVDASKGGKR